jgi:hypothetical protein
MMDTKTLVRGDLAAVWDGDDIVVLNRGVGCLCRYTTDFLEKSLKDYDEKRWGSRPTLLEYALMLSERGANEYMLWDMSPSDLDSFDRLMRLNPFQVTT